MSLARVGNVYGIVKLRLWTEVPVTVFRHPLDWRSGARARRTLGAYTPDAACRVRLSATRSDPVARVVNAPSNPSESHGWSTADTTATMPSQLATARTNG